METLELLKYTSLYLPHKVRAYYEFLGEYSHGEWIDNVTFLTPRLLYDFAKENGKYRNLKLYLRPLSQLTEEIKHNGERFVPTELLDSDDYPIDFFVDTEFEYMVDWINHCQKNHHILFMPWGLINQLTEWHFDVFGLIEKGLALKKI